MIWGLVLIGTGFARNFETLIALRVLLGVLEAPIVPGNFLIVGMWYNRRYIWCQLRKCPKLIASFREQPIRVGLFYTGLSVCFTGPIGWGIGFIAGADKWRYFFWITGAMTCLWAIVVAIFLPDNPVKAKFITERQKAISIDRLRADQTGIENKTFKKEQMIETFLDPKTWLMFFFNIWISIPNGGLTNVIFVPCSSSTLLTFSSLHLLLSMAWDILLRDLHSWPCPLELCRLCPPICAMVAYFCVPSIFPSISFAELGCFSAVLWAWSPLHFCTPYLLKTCTEDSQLFTCRTST